VNTVRWFVQVNASLIHALELDVRHVIPLTSSGDVTMTVTLIDAGHCPGSVMFLFDGYFGHVLYTGHFRYDEEARLGDVGCLKSLRDPVDVLYIDNTFCSPKCVLPSRREAERQIIDIIEQHPTQRVVFGVRGLGKTDVLISLSKWFDVKVGVSEERYRTLRVLALHEQFVVANNSCEARTRFEMVELIEVTRSSVKAWNRTAPTIAVLLTGLFVGLGYQAFAGCTDIFVVPLSDHSPYAELQRFVATVRPRFVVPIVRTEPGRRDDPLADSLPDRTNVVEYFSEHLDPSPMPKYHIPLPILEAMNHGPFGRPDATGQANNSSSSKSYVSELSSAVSELRKWSRDFSPVDVLSSSISSVGAVPDTVRVTASDRLSTCNSPTPGIIRKLRPMAVRPLKRCVPSRNRCLQMQSAFESVKQRRQQSHSLNFSSFDELRQKRFVTTNQMLQRLLLPRRLANSGAVLSKQLNVFPAVKQSNARTSETNPNMLETTGCNESRVPVSTNRQHAHCVLCNGDNGTSRNCDTGNRWKSFFNPAPAVLRITESSRINSCCDGTTTNCKLSCQCQQENSEYTKKTNALRGCCFASPIASNDARNTVYNVVNAAIDLSARPTFYRIVTNSTVNDSLHGDSSRPTVSENVQTHCDDVKTASAAASAAQVSSLPPKKKWRQQFTAASPPRRQHADRLVFTK